VLDVWLAHFFYSFVKYSSNWHHKIIGRKNAHDPSLNRVLTAYEITELRTLLKIVSAMKYNCLGSGLGC
jgi:hypothetical protein